MDNRQMGCSPNEGKCLCRSRCCHKQKGKEFGGEVCPARLNCVPPCSYLSLMMGKGGWNESLSVGQRQESAAGNAQVGSRRDLCAGEPVSAEGQRIF